MFECYVVMDNINNAHYFLLPSQGNVYTLTKLCLINGINKVLVASLKRKVFSFEYTETSDGFLQPNVKEISFTYIPNGAEIISIDAFNKSKTCDDFCIGITIIKPNASLSEPGSQISETYLNIYTEQDVETNSRLNLENIAQNCLMLELNFIPYQLYHAEIVSTDQNSSCDEIVWLVSGSDFKVHVFQEDRLNHSYYEVEATELFPELKLMPSVIMWFSLKYTDDKTRRLTAIGCECGYMQLTVVDTKSGSILNTWTDLQDGPVSRVLIFKFQSPNMEPPEYIRKYIELKENATETQTPEFHLLVVNTLQPSLVFMNILKNGLTEKLELAESDQHDAAMCGGVGDLDFDGQMEILIGTYAERILMYKYVGEKWDLRGQYKLSNPIHALQYMDVSGDGVKELIVLTLTGVHILQIVPSVTVHKRNFVAVLINCSDNIYFRSTRFYGQHNPKDMCKILISRLKKLMGKEEPIEEDLNKEDEDSEKNSIPSEQESFAGCLDSEEYTCEEVSETSQEQSVITVVADNKDL